MLLDRMAESVLGVFKSRMGGADAHEVAGDLTDTLLLRVYANLWKRAETAEATGSPHHCQLLAAVVHEHGDEMVEWLLQQENGSVDWKVDRLLSQYTISLIRYTFSSSVFSSSPSRSAIPFPLRTPPFDFHPRPSSFRRIISSPSPPLSQRRRRLPENSSIRTRLWSPQSNPPGKLFAPS